MEMSQILPWYSNEFMGSSKKNGKFYVIRSMRSEKWAQSDSQQMTPLDGEHSSMEASVMGSGLCTEDLMQVLMNVEQTESHRL